MSRYFALRGKQIIFELTSEWIDKYRNDHGMMAMFASYELFKGFVAVAICTVDFIACIYAIATKGLSAGILLLALFALALLGFLIPHYLRRLRQLRDAGVQ